VGSFDENINKISASEEKDVDDQQHQDLHEQDGGEEGVPPV